MKIIQIAEKIVYFSRWLLAPIYIGLSLILLMLSLKFMQEVLTALPKIFSDSKYDLILLTLSLIDLSLVGGLTVMVMISGYENFISSLKVEGGNNKLDWIGSLSPGSLKSKVSAAIVAISSIHLLRIFMEVEKYDTNRLLWYVTIHLTFVVSAFVVVLLDKLTDERH